MFVRANGSSANLGAGFDVLGLSIRVPFDLQVVGHGEPDADLLPMEPSHPAHIAWVTAGGNPGAALRWRSPIPPGRGQGFSGAARVAGAFAAGCDAGMDEGRARDHAFEVAAQLEGHPDNAAPSAYGGLLVAAAGHVVPVPVPERLRVVLWWPERTTSTDASRRALSDPVSREDAVFNVGRVALFVAGLAAGRLDVLEDATADRLHQEQRLDLVPESRVALEALRPHAVAVWLSGSGSTIAGFVPVDGVEAALAALPPEGRSRAVEVGDPVHEL